MLPGGSINTKGCAYVIQSRRCEKCGADLGATAFGELCFRCLLADGLGPSRPLPNDTHRLRNPLFIQRFGDYDLLEEIARGGMGVVYKALQKDLGRTVALKILSAGEFASPENRLRFRQEAAAAARLQHPNIVGIHQVGECDGVHYFTMEFVDGPSLAQLVGGRPLEPMRAAVILKTLGEAIDFAHQRGVLHRDLKPSNVLIDPFGEPRVTDFGLAKLITGDPSLTVTGQVLGTPGYLPPEQADSSLGAVSPASDVYSLGAILYFALTARAPFAAGSIQETLRQMLNNDPVAPAILNPGVPRDLETICLRCLERDPSRRYLNAAAFADDLARFIRGEPIVARPLSSAARLARWCHRRPGLAAAWIAVGALAVVSTISAITVGRARSAAERALSVASAANTNATARLREARLEQARALRRTSEPGRRAGALKALAEAANIEPGLDLRVEAANALQLFDIQPAESWDLQLASPADVDVDPGAGVAVIEFRTSVGGLAGNPFLQGWGQSNRWSQLQPGAPRLGGHRFSRDGSTLMARYADDAVRLFRIGRASPAVTLTNLPAPGVETGSEAHNSDYDFSPDGKLFAVGLAPRGLSIHSTTDGRELTRTGAGESFNLVRWSPDGRQIAAARLNRVAERQVWLFSAPDLAVARTLPAPDGPEWCDWSADAASLAVLQGGGSLRVYDSASLRLLREIRSTTLGRGECWLAGRGQLAGARGTGSTLRLFNAGAGVEELVVDDYGPSLATVRPSGDEFLAVSMLGVATRWRIEYPVGRQTLYPPRAGGYDATGSLGSFDVSSDGRWIASAHGRRLCLRNGAGVWQADYDGGSPNGLEFSSVAFIDDGRALLRLSTGHGMVRLPLIIQDGGPASFGPAEPIRPFTGFLIADSTAHAARFLLINLFHGAVKVVDWRRGQIEIVSEWDEPDANNGAFSPDGESVLINCAGTAGRADQRRLRLYRARDGAVLRELSAPVSCDAAWSENGRTAMTSNGQRTSIFWDTATWLPKAKLEGPLGGDTTTFALAPDGTYAVVAHGPRITLVASATGQVLVEFECPGAAGQAAGIRFLPGGQTFVVHWPDGRLDFIRPEEIRRSLSTIGLAW